MAFEHYIYNGTKKLRCGYTTGSCATLAAKACAKMLITKKIYESAKILTPKGIEVETELLDINISKNKVSCAIKKDAGDDIDATDKILIYALVETIDEKKIIIDGGIGVGRVTKRGLDQAVGNAAINSTPRSMIKKELLDLIKKYNYNKGFKVTIYVPAGGVVAKKTFNESMGIKDGISILGTTGIVEPQSLKALSDSIKVEIKMHAKQGKKDLILIPGNYGEEFLQIYLEENPNLKDIPTVKISNFIGDALDYASLYEFENVLFLSHIGKAIKVAGGVMNTHSRYADCRTEIFAASAALVGASQEVISKIMDAKTTDACIEIIYEQNYYESVINRLTNSIERHLIKRSMENYRSGTIIFSRVYGLLGISKTAKNIINDWNARGKNE